MREILFRGKRINNSEYIEGDLLLCEDGWYIKCRGEIDYRTCRHARVFPETVSQFTGVTDKNEIKVFENDKVLVHENVCGEIKDWTAKVAFKGGSFCLVNEEDYPICSLFETCGTFEVIPE